MSLGFEEERMVGILQTINDKNQNLLRLARIAYHFLKLLI